MKWNLYTIACISAVSLGIGYLVGGIQSSSASGKSLENTAELPRQTKSTSRERQARESSGDEMLADLLKGRSAQELPDDELLKILLQLSEQVPIYDTLSYARKNYQLELLIAKLPISRLEQVAEALAAEPDAKRSGRIVSLVSAMASKDPKRALAWAKKQKSAPGLIESVIGMMAKEDPMMAADLYRESLLDGTISRGGVWLASYGVGSAMARLGKNEFLHFVDSLPHDYQGNILSNCNKELPKADQMALMDEIYRRTKQGRMQDWQLKNLFFSSLTTDSARAEAWLEKMEPGKERTSLELSTANQFLQNGDSDAARKWMMSAIAQSPGQEKELFSDAADQQMDHGDSGGIALFASLLPAHIEIKAADLERLAQNSAHNGFSGLTGLAVAIRDPAEQTKLITSTIERYASSIREGSTSGRMNATDFAIFSRQLQTLNLTGEHATKVAESLAAAQNAKPKAKE